MKIERTTYNFFRAHDLAGQIEGLIGPRDNEDAWNEFLAAIGHRLSVDDCGNISAIDGRRIWVPDYYGFAVIEGTYSKAVSTAGDIYTKHSFPKPVDVSVDEYQANRKKAAVQGVEVPAGV